MHEYPKSVRLLKPAEFRKVYDTGIRYACAHFAAFSLPSAEDRPARFGFTCPRALGKSVKRNRMKRRLRECVRLRRERFPQGLDVVFNPRRSLLDADWADVEKQLDRYLERLENQK